MKQEFLELMPPEASLEARFSFVDNDVLRSNIVIYFRYITFLLKLSEDKSIDALAYSLNKDIILYTASIIESLLEYTVSREILKGNAEKKVFGKGEKVSALATIDHACASLEESNSKLQVIKKSWYFRYGTNDRIDFKDITHAAKASGILDAAEYEAAESLRKKRNTIHISTLTRSSDDYFEKKDVEDAFTYASRIIRKIEPLFA